MVPPSTARAPGRPRTSPRRRPGRSARPTSRRRRRRRRLTPRSRRSSARRRTRSRHGRRSGVVRGTRIDLVDENVLQIAGVRPRLNRLRFAVEVLGRVRVKRVRIFGDSALRSSRIGPGEVELRVSVSPGRRVLIGETLRVTAILRNPHGRPVRNAFVQLRFPARVFAPIGRSRVFVPFVATRAVRLAFRLRALRLGAHEVALDVDSLNGAPYAVVRTTVVRPPADDRVVRWGAFGAVILGAMLVLAGRRLRRGRDDGKSG